MSQVEPSATSLPNPLVRKLEGFATLSDADRRLLERISAETRLVSPRTDLVRQSSKPDGVFLIMEGMACRQKYRTKGQRQIMAYLLPGDLCGLDDALLSRMDHSITTLSVCRVVRIAPETMTEILQHHPQVARALRMSALVDEATLREWLVNLGRRYSVERLAHLFCELLMRLQAVGRATKNSYALPLTQTDLADTMGMSDVHVNRSLQELRQEELIELRRGHLTIPDPSRLQAVAEYKADYLHRGDQAAT
jgi:CRP-like cAMP-binding protein